MWTAPPPRRRLFTRSRRGLPRLPDGMSVTSDDERHHDAVQSLLLTLGVALTMTGDAVSEIQTRLRTTAAAYGFDDVAISVLPTFLMVSLHDGGSPRMRTIDSIRQLRLDQASQVIAIARECEQGLLDPAEAATSLRRTFARAPRFGIVAYVAAHALLTLGLGLLTRP